MAYLPKKSSKLKSKYPVTILCDDRERHPWKMPCKMFKLKKKRLKVGDYTIKGFEDIIAIEKKSGIVELISNLSSKDRPRFKAFLKRLSLYPIKCIVIEDSLSHIEAAFRSCPKTHLEPASIYYWLSVIMLQYNIPVLFIGKNKQHREALLYWLFSEALNQAKKF